MGCVMLPWIRGAGDAILMRCLSLYIEDASESNQVIEMCALASDRLGIGHKTEENVI